MYIFLVKFIKNSLALKSEKLIQQNPQEFYLDLSSEEEEEAVEVEDYEEEESNLSG